eukprot:snap_masked-scaffold_2-processed-gene-26.11-mRNA-1 protein AED:1.00 eAED:1.00 QI:0/-1/0/0/-1/1/1/0/366
MNIVSEYPNSYFLWNSSLHVIRVTQTQDLISQSLHDGIHYGLNTLLDKKSKYTHIDIVLNSDKYFYQNYKSLVYYLSQFTSLRYIYLDPGKKFLPYCTILNLFLRKKWTQIQCLSISYNSLISFSKLELKTLADIICLEIKPIEFSFMKLPTYISRATMSSYLPLGIYFLERVFQVSKIKDIPDAFISILFKRHQFASGSYNYLKKLHLTNLESSRISCQNLYYLKLSSNKHRLQELKVSYDTRVLSTVSASVSALFSVLLDLKSLKCFEVKITMSLVYASCIFRYFIQNFIARSEQIPLLKLLIRDRAYKLRRTPTRKISTWRKHNAPLKTFIRSTYKIIQVVNSSWRIREGSWCSYICLETLNT